MASPCRLLNPGLNRHPHSRGLLRRTNDVTVGRCQAHVAFPAPPGRVANHGGGDNQVGAHPPLVLFSVGGTWACSAPRGVSKNDEGRWAGAAAGERAAFTRAPAPQMREPAPLGLPSCRCRSQNSLRHGHDGGEKQNREGKPRRGDGETPGPSICCSSSQVVRRSSFPDRLLKNHEKDFPELQGFGAKSLFDTGSPP